MVELQLLITKFTGTMVRIREWLFWLDLLDLLVNGVQVEQYQPKHYLMVVSTNSV